MAAALSQPWHPDPLTEWRTTDARSVSRHLGDDLVARNDRELGFGQFAIDQMQIGAANAAGANPEQELAWAGLWSIQ